MTPKKYAVVTGAASGLGRGYALKLASMGWEIAVCDINAAGSEETRKLVEELGGSAIVHQLDVRNSEQWLELKNLLKRRWPQIDLLINNAGVGGGGTIGKISLEDTYWIVDVNIRSVISGCHTFIDWLKENPNKANIINVSSMATYTQAPNMGGYNASKAAVSAFSETLRVELAIDRANVGVIDVCTRFVDTNIIENSRFESEEFKKFSMFLSKQDPVPVSKLVDVTFERMARGKRYVFRPILMGYFIHYMRRFFPSVLSRMSVKEKRRLETAYEQERVKG